MAYRKKGSTFCLVWHGICKDNKQTLNFMRQKEQYRLNKLAKVGEMIVCPICKEEFKKKQYSQAFCCTEHKDKYWNIKKSDRHSDTNYHHKYNIRHPERLERIGIYQNDFGEFGYYNDDDEFVTFKEEYDAYAMCENPQLGI